MQDFIFAFGYLSLVQWVECTKFTFTKISWVVVASALMQPLYFPHVLIVQTEFCYVCILFHPFHFDAFWNYCQSLLNGPSQNDLMRRHFVLFGDFLDFIVFINRFFTFFGKPDFLVRTGSKTGVADHLNSFLSCVSDKLPFIELGMDFGL